MTNTVLIKRSGVANSVPVAGNLSLGELAINYADGNLFYKNSSGSVTVIASNKFVSVTGNVTANNVVATTIVDSASFTGGLVSVTGNVNSANVVATTLSATGNVVANNVIATTIVNAASHTGTILSITGNVTAGGGTFGAGNISTTGNISAGYFIGNGSQLTGITAGSGGSYIANGTSNVAVVSLDGNVSVGVGGTSNVAVFATTGEYITGALSVSGNISGNGSVKTNLGVLNPNSISTNYTVETGYNGLLVGPITLNSGIVFTVPTGQTFVIV